MSIESFFAASTKPQVLTTAISASSASSTSSNPSAASRPASSSESTSLRAQPRVISATLCGAAPEAGETGMVELSMAPGYPSPAAIADPAVIRRGTDGRARR